MEDRHHVSGLLNHLKNSVYYVFPIFLKIWKTYFFKYKMTSNIEKALSFEFLGKQNNLDFLDKPPQKFTQLCFSNFSGKHNNLDFLDKPPEKFRQLWFSNSVSKR